MKKILSLLLGKKTALIASGGLLTMACAFLSIHEPLLLQFLNNKIHDIYLTTSHNTKTTGMVAVVDIDEQSLERLGQWPWPRYRMALLLERLTAMNPRAVALDIIFAEPDRTSLRVVRDHMARDLQYQLPLQGVPPALLDNDRLFAGSLSRSPAILSFFLRQKHDDATEPAPSLAPLSLPVIRKPGAPAAAKMLLHSSAMTAPLDLFQKAARTSGFTNTIPDADGMLRRTPLLMATGEKIYPSLALAAVHLALGSPPLALRMSSGGVESLKIGPATIPLDRNGRIIVHYRGPQRVFPYLSAVDILEGRVLPQEIAGKIIFIGSSAAGLKDIRATPFDPVYPGMEAQATVADTILAGDFIQRPDWAPGLELSLVLLSGVLATITITLVSARWTLPVTAMAMALFWFGGMWALQQYRFTLSPLVPVITVGLIFSGITVLKFWMEEKEKRFLRSAFSRYVPDTVVQKLTADPKGLSLAGEEKFMTILFSDIRGFTSLSETLAPSDVTEILRLYFTPMTRTILAHQGTIDKFIGDALMAFWNAPLDVDGHQRLGIQAAMAMQQELARLNPEIKKKFGITLAAGIGLHAGTVRVGNMGSDDLFDYTVIGDEVNLTSRLEGLSKFYGVFLVTSDVLIPYCPEGVVPQELDTVLVKGKEKPVTIFTLHDAASGQSFQEELARYTEGLELYKKQRFVAGEKIFSQLALTRPDTVLYTLYRDRCREFQLLPPPDDWDGSYRHLAK